MKTLFLLLLLSTSLWATDIHVATTGNDTSNTGTIDHPYKTVGRALRAWTPGDQVVVHAGNYPLGPASVIQTVPVVGYPGDDVRLTLPDGTLFHLNAGIVVWSSSVPASDVQVVLKPEDKLTNVKWTFRKTNTATDVLCTVNRDTKVEVVK